jgi:hypothetical protein
MASPPPSAESRHPAANRPLFGPSRSSDDAQDSAIGSKRAVK